MTELLVLKRDGSTTQPFSQIKLESSISKAWAEVEVVEASATRTIKSLATKVLNTCETQFTPTGLPVSVEDIQNIIEITLMGAKKFKVAKRYILYREEHAKLRGARQHPDPKAIADYIHPAKYGRYQPMELRREVYLETTKRVKNMHKEFFGAKLSDKCDRPGGTSVRSRVLDRIEEVFTKFVDTKRILPSMRSMQFGGAAQLSNHCRGYNCTSSYVDRPRVFQEALYLLLCGCGVGYSVQTHHVAKLPALKKFIPEEAKVKHYTIPDTIEGWAEAMGELIQSVLTGVYIEFDYHEIRAQGTPLKTSGGKAPGHLPLKTSLEAIRKILYAALGRQLTPIECHDIMCILSDAVLSGGIRRSAMIAIFSIDDYEMGRCKTGQWYETAPWRENANNSAMVLRSEVTLKEFKSVFKMIREWGEPGFFFSNSLEYMGNPCLEIGMYPFSKLLQMSGWSFCNLAEINGALVKSLEDFLEVAAAAAFLGTLQAAYTDFPYLGAATEDIVRRDALLGVGITGMMDSPDILTDPKNQRQAACVVLLTNAIVARDLGINPAKRATCIKPSGSTSLALGCVGSGIHAHHSRRYIRRVTANEDESVFQYFRSINPHMCVQKPNKDWVIEFPIEAPEGAILKEHISALDFLRKVTSTQTNWVRSGTGSENGSPGLHHNVSNTVTVRPNEWEEVASYIWDHKDLLTGVSLLAAAGDKDYAFAPNEAVTTPTDEARWNHLVANYTPVDYSQFLEAEDGTNLSGEAACSAGGCS